MIKYQETIIYMFAISLLIVAIILSINKKRVGNTINVFLGKTHYKFVFDKIPRNKNQEDPIFGF